MLQYLSTTFIAGILALLPLLISVTVAWFVYSKLLVWFGPGSRFGKLPKLLAEKTAMHPVLAYLSIFALVVMLIFGVGALAKRSTERRISQFVERIPILRSIYGGTEQVVAALQLTERGVPNSYTQVLLVRLTNASVLGVQTCSNPISIEGRQYLSVYFPNSPIPATGQIWLVPEEDTRRLDMSVEELMQVYVSMGSLAGEKLQDIRMLPSDAAGGAVQPPAATHSPDVARGAEPADSGSAAP